MFLLNVQYVLKTGVLNTLEYCTLNRNVRVVSSCTLIKLDSQSSNSSALVLPKHQKAPIVLHQGWFHVLTTGRASKGQQKIGEFHRAAKM